MVLFFNSKIGGARDQAHYTNTVTIVLNLQQLQSTVLDRDLYRGRSSIERVFNEFFESIGWSVDNLCRW